MLLNLMNMCERMGHWASTSTLGDLHTVNAGQNLVGWNGAEAIRMYRAFVPHMRPRL